MQATQGPRTYTLLAAAMALPIILLIVLQIVFALDRERAAVVDFALSRAERIMLLADAQTRADRAVMEVLASAEMVERHDWPLAYARMREVAALNPHWRTVTISDLTADAEIISLARPYASTPAPINATIAQARDISREGPGCPCLYLHTPIGADGRYRLSVGVDPEVFRTLLLRNLPEGAIAALVDADGIFLARSHEHDERVGTPATRFVRAAIAGGGDSGLYAGTTYEGFRNHTAFVVSAETGWSAHVAIASGLIDRPRAYSSAAIAVGSVLALMLAGALIYWALRDLGRRRVAEDRMAQTQKLEAIGQLTGGVAHDFNNLLTVMIGGLNMLLKRIEDPKQREIAEHMLETAKRGDRLTKQLLAFSRGKRMELAPVDLHVLAPGMEELLRRSVSAGTNIGFDLHPDARWVKTDANQIELAILNLVINARDAMPDGGDITISTRPSAARPDCIELGVRDSGLGMPRDVAERAMEPFFTTKPAGKGTGLGLAQVFGAARQSGGSVEIESAPDRGTMVRLLLPRSEAATPAPAQSLAEPKPSPAAGQRILVVDDEPGVLSFVASTLSEAGYAVTSAADPGEALHLLTTAPAHDLLLTDFSMPAMNGLELAERARMAHADLRVLIISGWADADALEKSAARPRLLRKPFDERVLLDAVQAALATS
ncbi:MAG: response regulator [Caulobacterales bacterium]|nr:response regulator [Caulobacterales bacterium]